jgi:carbonic anhydrase
MSVTDELLENNAAYAADFTGGLPSPPARAIAIVACMDARLQIEPMLGLRSGDAHIIRNAGGIVTDQEIRSLTISQRLLGTREIVLVHHTGCGMVSTTDAEFAAALERDTGSTPPWSGGFFADAETDVRESLARIRASEFLPFRDAVRGFVFDITTGRLSEIV